MVKNIAVMSMPFFPFFDRDNITLRLPMYHANNSLARAHNIQFAVNTPAYLKIVEVMGLQGYSNDKFYIASTSRSVIKV